jgi:hypothetical protein
MAPATFHTASTPLSFRFKGSASVKSPPGYSTAAASRLFSFDAPAANGHSDDFKQPDSGFEIENLYGPAKYWNTNHLLSLWKREPRKAKALVQSWIRKWERYARDPGRWKGKAGPPSEALAIEWHQKLSKWKALEKLANATTECIYFTEWLSDPVDQTKMSEMEAENWGVKEVVYAVGLQFHHANAQMWRAEEGKVLARVQVDSEAQQRRKAMRDAADEFEYCGGLVDPGNEVYWARMGDRMRD